MEYLSLGVINDSFGVDGTVKIYSTTSFSSLRYKEGSKVYLTNPHNQGRKELTTVKFRHNGLFDFVKFEELTTPEEVKLLKGYEIQIEKTYEGIEKDTYYYSDLRGCIVCDESGNELGKVKEVEEFPAQLTLRVARKNKPDFFVPYIKEFIKSVDISAKKIIIYVIEGLLW